MNRKATAAVLGAGSLWGIISIFVRQLNAMGLTALQYSPIPMIRRSSVKCIHN